MFVYLFLLMRLSLGVDAGNWGFGNCPGYAVGEGHDPPGQWQVFLAVPSKGTRLPKPSLRGAQRRGNPYPPQCERIAPAARPVMCPGLHCAPAGARKPYGLQGNGLPHQRARWFAMTDLGVRWVWRQRGGSGKLTAGASPRPTVWATAAHL